MDILFTELFFQLLDPISASGALPAVVGGLAGLAFYRLALRPYLRRAARSLLAVLGWRKPGHRRRERAARRVLQRLQELDSDGARLNYLRTVDPFVFEELVLEAFEQRGLRVKRNTRYTGDGGIDGRVWSRSNQLHLVQAKRYSNHINPKHVRSFSQMIEKQGVKGIFVHTGRTGQMSRQLARSNPNMTVISGERLLRLVTPPSQTAAA